MNDDDKILIVDDDEAIARLLSEILRSEGFSTRECLSGPAALEALAQDDFQLVLLDIMMPGMNGFETCQRIRENSDVPVVFLTAKNEESDLVLGFSLGADDYIVKPFKPRELVARVRTRIRRSKDRTVAKSPGLFDCDGLLIDTTRHVATLYDEELKLTPKEFGVLSLLARHAGKPVAIKDIFEEIWDEPYNSFDSNTVMVHIRRIRKKLSQVDSSREFIKTVFGVGYRLEVDRGESRHGQAQDGASALHVDATRPALRSRASRVHRHLCGYARNVGERDFQVTWQLHRRFDIRMALRVGRRVQRPDGERPAQ